MVASRARLSLSPASTSINGPGFTRTASTTIVTNRNAHAGRTQSRSPTFFSTAFFSAGIIWFGPRLTVSFSSFPVKSNGHA